MAGVCGKCGEVLYCSECKEPTSVSEVGLSDPQNIKPYYRIIVR